MGEAACNRALKQMVFILIDGYNFIRQVETYKTIEEKGLVYGREKFLKELEAYGCRTGHNITVVFDAAGSPCFEESQERYAGIDVIYTQRGVSADQRIVEIVKEHSDAHYDVVVVSADKLVQYGTLQNAGFTLSPREFDLAIKGGTALSY